MIQSILSIVVALGVLITFHEFGHYYVARRCGVKVLRFSVGFGKPLYRFVNQAGTEFVLALIPLGGYVRMLDEREGEVADAEKSQAFNNKNVWQRIAIVAAGPLANFLLAIVLYVVVALMGVRAMAPIIGGIDTDSPAAQTELMQGDELVQINGESVSSWEEVNLSLARLIGHSGDISLRYRSQGSDSIREDRLTLDRWLVGEEPSSLLGAFGFQAKSPAIPADVEQVMRGGAAEKAGILVGDIIVQAANQPVADWKDFVKLVQANPNKELSLRVKRNALEIPLVIVPAARETATGVIGYVGLGVKPVALDDSWFRVVQYGPISALGYGLEQTWTMVSLTFSSIGKMLQGLISVDNLSGPITIAKVASASAESGVQSFLKFMAYLSVSLGVLNLLPIPMLDGGHLLFFSIEAVRRKAVSERIQYFAYRLGAALLFTLMAIAIVNDIARL